MEERDHIRSAGDEDQAIESAVLQHLLALHPATVTTDEIAREMGGGDSFAERDAVKRALRDLAGAGLLHVAGPLVLPSRAALRFDELLGE
ncbi:MAG: hypothetical protein ACRDLL_16265 [Solirubrobacterales bacterium]